MAHEALAEHCIELFSPLGRARAKRMFGGQGLYVDELFIALIADGKLFLKTSETTRQHFADAGGQPFVYGGSEHKPTVVMSYWTPPPEALESPALMTPWARLAIEAALAARKPSTQRKSGKPASSTKAVKATRATKAAKTAKTSAPAKAPASTARTVKPRKR